MTQQEIESDNKLIAEFMGWEVMKEEDFLGYNYPKGRDLSNVVVDVSLEYHKSWDWLMPVLEKIEMMLPEDVNTVIEFAWCNIPVIDAGGIESNFDINTEGNTKLEAVYKAVVEFIKWYNKHK